MPSFRLYRLAALAGLVCAVVLVVNSARRVGLVPDTAVTGTIAPLAGLAGLFALTGLYLIQRGPAGAFGTVGYALNFAGLSGVFAIEYTLHFVFPGLSSEQITDLLEGATGTAFAGTAAVLVIGALLFGAASLRARVLPAPAVGLYAIGMVPGSLRSVVPDPVYLTGLVVAAVGIAWLSLALWRRTSRRPAGDRQPALA
jgi:hypothetical protein